MIVFIPAFILLGAAIAVIVLQYVPRGTGFAWFASVIFALAAWVISIVFRTRLPIKFSGQYWITFGLNNQIPSFQMDIITWPFALIICSLVVCVLLVASIRIGMDSNPEEWASILLVGALGYLGVISNNILTVMLVMACIDLVEVAILIFSSTGSRKIDFEIKSILWRIAGLTLFLAAFGWQISLSGTADEWRTLQASPVHLLLFSCAVRLGLMPIPFLAGSPRINKNGIMVIRGIVNFLTVSVVIIQLPFFPVVPVLKILFLIYLLITAIISSIRVLLCQNRGDFATDLQIAAGSLLCAIFILGFSSAGISLAITISVLAAILLLKFPAGFFSTIFGFLAVVAFSGLPVTPNVSGFTGFGLSGDFPGVLFLIPVVILLYSAVRIVLKQTIIENENIEQWTRIISPIGLIFPIISSWVVFINSVSSTEIFNISIPGIISVFICIAFLINSKYKIFNFSEFFEKVRHGISEWKKTHNGIPGAFLDSSKTPSLSPLAFITNLFEGDGGVLWSVLSLVLIITIIRTLGFTP